MIVNYLASFHKKVEEYCTFLEAGDSLEVASTSYNNSVLGGTSAECESLLSWQAQLPTERKQPHCSGDAMCK